MHQTKKTILAICLCLLSTSLLFAKGIEFQHISLDEAVKKAKQENKSLFIDIYATWCGPCKYLSNNVFTDESLGTFMNENFISIKLDGEKQDGASLMTEFALDAFPTMLFITPENNLLKKIVGVVSAHEIKDAGNKILHPETTELFKLQKRHESGERDKDFLKELIIELVIEERENESESIIQEYLKLYPELDLTDEDEFLIFCLGIEDPNHKLTKEFLKSPEKYKNLHPELSESKMSQILVLLIKEAVEKDDPSIIRIGIEDIFPAYELIFSEDSYSKEELNEVLFEFYVEEGGKF